jgi:hypothetical protein
VKTDGRQWVCLHAFLTSALHTLNETLHVPAAVFKQKDVSLSKDHKVWWAAHSGGRSQWRNKK